jgi:hypothetical protein
MIGAREPHDESLQRMFRTVNEGVNYCEGNKKEPVGYISIVLEYPRDDTEEWPKTVQGVKL